LFACGNFLRLSLRCFVFHVVMSDDHCLFFSATRSAMKRTTSDASEPIAPARASASGLASVHRRHCRSSASNV